MWASEKVITRCPIQDCSLSIDIDIQSSDGKRSGSHTKNLDLFNAAFSSVRHKTEDVVEFSEDAALLELLLKFSHNTEFPDISGLGMDVLSDFESRR
ncbi:hypothetical protein VNI00_016376 [Paramarasmius palmivorus]|uniref:Uncharacterized protein n=1 Tax=Paramarasmius palmivorus TaxID=297713 RepID=A0AAW0BFY2_9AGAR